MKKDYHLAALIACDLSRDCTAAEHNRIAPGFYDDSATTRLRRLASALGYDLVRKSDEVAA